MNILFINIPSRRGQAGKVLPMGLLYAGSAAKRAGHNVIIEDPYITDPSLRSFCDISYWKGLIDRTSPGVIGFGGIATSYGRAKWLSNHIKKEFPGIVIVAGGALSSVSDLLIKNTGVDVVFHGEAEITFTEFLSRISKGEQYSDISGISFKKEGSVIKNPAALQIKDIDEVPLPDYGLIELSEYIHDTSGWMDHYALLMRTNENVSYIKEKIRGKGGYIPIVSSRGCTHACFFCYRHFKGIRRHSVEYVIAHIKYLMGLGLQGFQFCDELFNSDPGWVREFCMAVKKEGLDIYYMIVGARVDRMDEELLGLLKGTGCVEINYGQESGSDTVLKEYRKGVTSSDNKRVTLMTKNAGINCPVQLVIGAPSETGGTIDETIGFLKECAAFDYSANYIIPLPETPSWDVVTDRGLVRDIEKYLDRVAVMAGRPIINLTRESGYKWFMWKYKMKIELKLHYFKRYNPAAFHLMNAFYKVFGICLG